MSIIHIDIAHSGADIGAAIMDYVDLAGLKKDLWNILGCDGTVSNTGHAVSF